jgi:Extensin-like protein C-terminus
MTRGVALSLVGSLVLVALAGCGRWIEQREPWRHDAEVECLQSGAVRESAAVALMGPIEGPGICGADFPLKVAALGGSSALGFADDPRPPGMIPSFPPYPAQAPISPQYAPPPRLGAPIPVGQGAGDPAAGPPPRDPYVYPSPRVGGGAQQPWAPPARVSPPRAPAPIASGPAAVMPAATLACPLVSALDQWLADAVQPAAQRWFGQPVIEIKQISAYSCRSMNGQRGAPISEHAFGNALDLAAFTLADGRRVTVKGGWRGLPEERGFLRDVHAAACRQFSTVLAPGSNAFHYDHIHVDLARHASGRGICNPPAIPGDAVAGREPLFTGSTRAGRSGRSATGFAPAVPGED